jgi:hypothetical protein
MVSKRNDLKPASPKKAASPPSMREKLKHKKEKPVPTIRVHGFFEPFAVEAYEYTLTDIKPGFVHKYRLWAKGELEVEELTEANFVGVKMQRDNAINGNEVRKDSDGYSRVWMIRYPTENQTTAATRRDGLRILKSFFMSKTATDYPPKEIKVFDETSKVPDVLETFFLDEDIEEIVKASFDPDELDDDFYTKYGDLSQTIYLNKEPSDFARHMLGFPSLG